MMLVLKLVKQCSSSKLVIVTRVEEANLFIKFFFLAILNHTEKRVRQKNFSRYNQEFTSRGLVELISPVCVAVKHFLKLMLVDVVFLMNLFRLQVDHSDFWAGNHKVVSCLAEDCCVFSCFKRRIVLILIEVVLNKEHLVFACFDFDDKHLVILFFDFLLLATIAAI